MLSRGCAPVVKLHASRECNQYSDLVFAYEADQLASQQSILNPLLSSNLAVVSSCQPFFCKRFFRFTCRMIQNYKSPIDDCAITNLWIFSQLEIIMTFYNNRACKQHSNNAPFHWNFEKFSSLTECALEFQHNALWYTH